MKTTAITVWAGLALITATQAGTPSTIMTPAPSAELWQWFAGGSVGYLTQLDEEMYSLQAGAEYQTPGTSGNHAFYLQVGYAQDDNSYNHVSNLPGDVSEMANIDVNIIPITLDYKYETTLVGQLSGYVGLGLGVAILDGSYDWSWTQAVAPPNGTGGGRGSQTDVRFYGEVFAGLGYKVCKAFEVFGGARYIFMDDVDQSKDRIFNYTAGINNDVLIELGARIRF
ncbi:MAG: hypothetical protein WCS43_05615 [Verrucomicrobiota bacterium]